MQAYINDANDSPTVFPSIVRPGEILLNEKGGNVGIGTTNPQATLHVQGNIRSTDGIYSMNFLYVKSNDSVKSEANLELVGYEPAISTHGRHAHINSVSAGSDFRTDLDIRVRSDVSYTNITAQKQARISWNGIIYARTSVSNTGADYAELFEWEDGNPHNNDRTGQPVYLTTGGKVAVATTSENKESIIGVVSAIYSILGNNPWDEWHGRYVVDSLGRPVFEKVEVVTWFVEGKEHTYVVKSMPVDVEIPSNAIYSVVDQHVENKNFDNTHVYVPREKRKEWAAIGLVGRVRVLSAFPKPSRWIKLRDIDEYVEEYLAI